MSLDIMAISLTQGLFALVDGNDYEELTKHKWHANKSGNTYYAARRIGKWPNQKTILMHRVILNTPKGMDTDHQNHYGLDNRKINLRPCTHSQNLANGRKEQCYLGKSTTSLFKGVHWNKNAQKWSAQITCNSKKSFLGYFNDEIEAAKAYDKKAKNLFREFAKLNFGD